jgi:NAD dependent epimerase/dehydratase family enzyme
MGQLVLTLKKAVGTALQLSVPERVVRGVFGQMADETALSDLTVLPARLLDRGYAFRLGSVEAALRHVMGAVPRDHHPDIDWHAAR